MILYVVEKVRKIFSNSLVLPWKNRCKTNHNMLCPQLATDILPCCSSRLLCVVLGHNLSAGLTKRINQ